MTALVIETDMAFVTALVIETDMAIVTVLASKPIFNFPESKLGIKCKELVPGWIL